jgi:hypothetical protein
MEHFKGVSILVVFNIPEYFKSVCVCVCVCVCARARVRACVRACVCVCVSGIQRYAKTKRTLNNDKNENEFTGCICLLSFSPLFLAPPFL